jgi:hypothetical protein
MSQGGEKFDPPKSPLKRGTLSALQKVVLN